VPAGPGVDWRLILRADELAASTAVSELGGFDAAAEELLFEQECANVRSLHGASEGPAGTAATATAATTVAHEGLRESGPACAMLCGGESVCPSGLASDCSCPASLQPRTRAGHQSSYGGSRGRPAA
jgi:hypothetical protein